MENPIEPLPPEDIQSALVAELLRRVREGDAAAREELVQSLYGELHRCARAQMIGQPAGHTLQPTALLNEACMKLLRPSAGPWNDRDHFLRAAAKAMRRILVDHARAKKGPKRAGVIQDIAIDRIVIEYEDSAQDLEALDHSLTKLEASDPKMAAAIEARFFGGLTVEEAARVAGLAPRTFERRWKAIRAWLFKELR